MLNISAGAQYLQYPQYPHHHEVRILQRTMQSSKQEKTKWEKFEVVQDSLEGKGYVVGIPRGKKRTGYMRNSGLISPRWIYITF
jgi:hypothetical protein